MPAAACTQTDGCDKTNKCDSKEDELKHKKIQLKPITVAARSEA
jgi:hypothetical protein